ncbi:hypothetical protein PC120_g7525 [Phytophthora cactorum]|nr:hypothetical protein PC120_g7525 [Phytophthora cactorum]
MPSDKASVLYDRALRRLRRIHGRHHQLSVVFVQLDGAGNAGCFSTRSSGIQQWSVNEALPSSKLTLHTMMRRMLRCRRFDHCWRVGESAWPRVAHGLLRSNGVKRKAA